MQHNRINSSVISPKIDNINSKSCLEQAAAPEPAAEPQQREQQHEREPQQQPREQLPCARRTVQREGRQL